MLVATTMEVSSAKDKNSVVCDMSFYGTIQEIWEVNYNMFKIVFFKCNWVQNNAGVPKDDLNYTLVDLSRIGHSSDSFIIATHGRHVFYVTNPVDVRWFVVVMPSEKDFFYKCVDDDIDKMLPDYPPLPSYHTTCDIDEGGETYARPDCEGIWVSN